MLVLCEVYAAVTVLFTAAYVYYGRNFSFPTLAWAMFFPGLFAPWFAPNTTQFILQVVGYGKLGEAAIYSVFGGLIAILVIGVLSFVVTTLKWGRIDSGDSLTPASEDPVQIVFSFLRAAGEEIGWRSYLLPCLMAHYAPWRALLYSGIVWGLYHVPVMVLLTKRLRVPHPYLTIAVQFTSVVISAFPHGWVAVLSGYSFWASTVMHFTWNRINPVVFGSIYTQTPGKVRGPIWLINGEGLGGCIVMLPLACAMVWDLSS